MHGAQGGGTATGTAGSIFGRLARVTSRPDGLADDARQLDAATGPSGPGTSEQPAVPALREPVQRWRLALQRTSLDSGPAQKAWLSDLVHGLVAAGLPIAGTDAVPPRPRVTIAAPLPAGIPGEGELVDVLLTAREPAWRVREAAASALPEGDALVACFDVWLGAPSLPGQVAASVYRMVVAAPASAGGREALLGRLRDAAAAMLAAPSLPRMRRKGDTEVPYELRPFLAGLEADRQSDDGIAVRAVLRHDPEKGIGRPEEVLAELAERTDTELAARMVVRERLVLADELAPRANDRATVPPGRETRNPRSGIRRAPASGGRRHR
jgi:hypothetical protein